MDPLPIEIAALVLSFLPKEFLPIGRLVNKHWRNLVGSPPPRPLDSINWAAGNGHTDCLRYLHENGCPWDRYACIYAADGHPDCLRYLHENGCPCGHK